MTISQKIKISSAFVSEHWASFGVKKTALSQVRICRPHPLSEVAIFTLKMHNVLKRMKNYVSDFSDFLFWSYWHPKRCAKINIFFKKGQIYRKDPTIKLYTHIIFCATLSFLDIVNFSNYCVHILQAFLLSVLGNFFFLK